MGSTHFKVPQEMTEQWVQMKSNGKVLIRNTISHQFFTIHHLPKKTLTNTKQYLRRSIYSLPHTPRIIVLQENQNQLYILAQQSHSQLKFLLRKKHLLIEVLQVLKELVGLAEQLRQKYGGFQIKEELMGVLKNQQILMWINSKFQLNQVQFPLKQNIDYTMIEAIFTICQKHCKLDLSFLLTHPAVMSFSTFFKHLSIKIEIEKLKICNKLVKNQQSINEVFSQVDKKQTLNIAVHSNLKYFDKKNSLQPNRFQRHRKQNTNIQFGKIVPCSLSPPKKRTNPRITSLEMFSPISQNKDSESLNSFAKKHFQFSQASIPTINLKELEHFKDSKVSGSHPNPTKDQITFCQVQLQKENNWDLKKRITCSTQENLGKFEQSYRRQSTIRWVQEPLAGQKSLIQEYNCLFDKTGVNLSRKTHHEQPF